MVATPTRSRRKTCSETRSDYPLLLHATLTPPPRRVPRCSHTYIQIIHPPLTYLALPVAFFLLKSLLSLANSVPTILLLCFFSTISWKRWKSLS